MGNQTVQTMGQGFLLIEPNTQLRDIEKIAILNVLKNVKFNRTHCARSLGIGIRTLQRKIRQYELEGAEVIAA